MSTPSGTPRDESNPYAPRQEGAQPPAYPQPGPYGQPSGHPGQQPPAAPAYPTAPGYPTAGPGYPSGYGPVPGTEANNLGVWALVLGVVGFLCAGLLTGIPAIILGHRSRKAAAEGRANNGGLGTAGLVLGWVTTVLSVLGIAVVGYLVATLGWEEFLNTYSTGYSYP